MIQQIHWIVYKPIKMSVGDGGIEKEIYKKSRIIKSYETETHYQILSSVTSTIVKVN